jgi:hypothetical protein
VVRVDTTAGTVWLDELDFRVAGPYVIPFISTGLALPHCAEGAKDGLAFPGEVGSSQLLDMLLQTFVAGGGGASLAVLPYAGGLDLAAIARANAFIRQTYETYEGQLDPPTYEDLLADGQPIPPNRFEAPGGVYVFGTERGADALIAVVVSPLAAVPAGETLVEFVPRRPGTLETVFPVEAPGTQGDPDCDPGHACANVSFGDDPADPLWIGTTRILRFVAHRDFDSDGHPDNADNCPSDWNEDQADTDLDGVGDVCEPG